MKYTFDKFKIQLVTKPHQPFKSYARPNHGLSNNRSIPQRTIKTASVSKNRQNHQNQTQDGTKNPEKQHILGEQYSNQMTRSQSLKNQPKQNSNNWLNINNLKSVKKQKEYRIFEQKCIDLLSKKKNNFHSSKMSQYLTSDKNSSGIFFDKGQKRPNVTPPNTVEQMMNNIIKKFKSDGRIRNGVNKQKIKPTFNQQTRNGSFFTINNQFAHNPHNSQSIMSKQQQNQIFRLIKSTQLRKHFQIQNKTESTSLYVKNQSQKCSQVARYQKEWKQMPEVTGIRINKLIKRQEGPKIDAIVCKSISLNSQHRQLRKNLFAFDHIDLFPMSKATFPQSAQSKRKKIHINKPSTLKKFMKFTKNSSDQQYNKKIKQYLDFLFKINYSNNIYVSLQLSSLDDTINSNNNHKYKVYVGPGNNCLLIKSLLKRRPWICIVQNAKQEGIQFFWTQNKVSQIHQRQERCLNYKQTLRNPQVKHTRYKSSHKALAQVKQLNSKLLSSNKFQTVQNYIFSDGYEIPFQTEYEPNVITNHIPENYVIGSKKNLFKSMLAYYTNIVKKDPFSVIPRTYHIKSSEDPEFRRFMKQNSRQMNKLWIVKPGQNTNRGNGIKLCKFSKIQSLIREKIKHPNGHLMTYIVQSYINKPFLYNGRKFDIRHYVLVTSVNGILKAYWYRDGYIRTSSQMYDIEDHDNELIHLTNDAIQMKGQQYGKYQDANKLSYSQFQRYLDYSFTGKGFNFDNIVKEMKSILVDVIKASYLSLDKDRKKDNFQLFGFDFMIDKDFKPYLIQINFNPCLVVNCNVLNRIIPPLIENTFRIGLDPLLPPKSHLAVNKRHNLSQNYLKNLRYELIFDQAALEKDIYNQPQFLDSEDQEEQYNDNGKQVPENFTF